MQLHLAWDQCETIQTKKKRQKEFVFSLALIAAKLLQWFIPCTTNYNKTMTDWQIDMGQKPVQFYSFWQTEQRHNHLHHCLLDKRQCYCEARCSMIQRQAEINIAMRNSKTMGWILAAPRPFLSWWFIIRVRYIYVFKEK